MTTQLNNSLDITFTATGQSTSFIIWKSPYNVSISGTFVGTVALERSFDQGATWVHVKDWETPAEKIGDEAEPGTYYRFNCTAFTSGSIISRLGSYYGLCEE